VVFPCTHAMQSRWTGSKRIVSGMWPLCLSSHSCHGIVAQPRVHGVEGAQSSFQHRQRSLLSVCLRCFSLLTWGTHGTQQRYDTCFNTWFASYLPLASSPDTSETERKTKADEYERKCGKTFEEYKACLQVNPFFADIALLLLPPAPAHPVVQKGIQQKGLAELIAQARADEPLASHQGTEWPLREDSGDGPARGRPGHR
jgi:TRIAP1/MDM35 family protein